MLVAGLATLHRETLIFAAVGIVISGADDLIMDALFLSRRTWRNLFVYNRHDRMTTVTLPPSRAPGRIAIFVPAWREADVIGAMLRHALRRWADADYCIFVGAYPNDPMTINAVAAISLTDPRIILAINPQAGPTTKADCLNILWGAMLELEKDGDYRFKAVVLHDAEDVVHADEIRLFDVMIDRFQLVQLPVLPLTGRGNLLSRAIANHYCDEFAEGHTRSLAIREALGASVPSAGVACAFDRDALAGLADHLDCGPFDPSSLTEDYEAGLRFKDMGHRGAFVRMRDVNGDLVATREYFPDTIHDAVKQKARWIVGISLAGWDRLGWRGGATEAWMRLRDRCAALSAFVLFAAYLAVLSWGLLWIMACVMPIPTRPLSPVMTALLWLNLSLMTWRSAIRAAFVGKIYGWHYGIGAVPRTIIANYIAILAARRAMFLYIRSLRGKPLVWDKTQHRFPDMQTDP